MSRITKLFLSLCCLALGSVPAQADVIFVNDDATGANDGSSWANAFKELQSALAAAQSGDEIWVTTGTYKPDYSVGTGQHTGDRTATFQLISGVALYGGFDGTETTLAERAGLFEQTALYGCYKYPQLHVYQQYRYQF